MYSLSGELSLLTGAQEKNFSQKDSLTQEDEEDAAKLAMEATAQIWGADEGADISDFHEEATEQYSAPVASSISNILNDLSLGESDISQSSQSEEEEVSRMPSLVKANNDSVYSKGDP